MSAKFEMYKSAMKDMTADIDDTLTDSSRQASRKRMMYARTKNNDPFPRHCYLCGTHDHVEYIEFGETGMNSKNILLVCTECRKWFGEFLVSGEDQKIKEIKN